MAEKADLERQIASSKTLGPGAEHYRAYVGPPDQYDFMGATQLALLFMLGLREEHHLLDVGCGSLRAGRLMMQFLMPGRYVGIEPNSWLWKQAISKEIGEDVVRIKAPLLIEDDSFSFSTIGRAFDFVVFQSILSHTAADLVDTPLREACKVLKDDGQVLFTVLDEATPAFKRLPTSEQETGWVYPGCVTFTQADIVSRCSVAGLLVQRLPWYHPRQSWYRAVRDASLLLDDVKMAQLGTGRPMFDPRHEQT